MVLFYEIILMIIAIAVLMGFMTHGFKKGAAAEISSLFSVLFALLILYLLTTAWNNFMTEHLGAIFSTILMIVIVVLAYKLLHIFFAGTRVCRWHHRGICRSVYPGISPHSLPSCVNCRAGAVLFFIFPFFPFRLFHTCFANFNDFSVSSDTDFAD